MQLRITVIDAMRGHRSSDMLVDAVPGATAAELVAALSPTATAAELAAALSPSATDEAGSEQSAPGLLIQGRRLRPEHPIGTPPLLDGALVILGGRGVDPSGWPPGCWSCTSSQVPTRGPSFGCHQANTGSAVLQRPTCASRTPTSPACTPWSTSGQRR